MRTRTTDKEPDPEDAPAPRQQRHFFLGNKATCSRLKAVASFYKVKDWVEVHEPEFFEAFTTKKTSRTGPKRQMKYRKNDEYRK